MSAEQPHFSMDQERRQREGGWGRNGQGGGKRQADRLYYLPIYYSTTVVYIAKEERAKKLRFFLERADGEEEKEMGTDVLQSQKSRRVFARYVVVPLSSSRTRFPPPPVNVGRGGGGSFC